MESQKKVKEAKISEPADSQGPEPTPEEIALRAYELHLQHGGEDGHDLEDWLEAELELRDKCKQAGRL